MLKQVRLLLLFLASGLTLSVSESQSVSLLPHAADSFNVSYIQVLLTIASREPSCNLSLSLFSKFSTAILISWRLSNIFWNSWRTRRLVLTWWLYLLVVRLLGIREIRSVSLLGMLMEIRFCFLFLASFFVYIIWVKCPNSFSCVCLRRIVNKPIEIKLRHVWLLHLSFTFNFFSWWNLCS